MSAPVPAIVTDTDLEQALERAGRQVRVPLEGIHGPGSMAWEVVRESIVFLGGGTAALLQLAHPYVAHGVDQHSSSRADVAGRFERTFRHMFAMSFGDLDSALIAARRVHRIHTCITGVITEDVGRFRRGHVYRANDAHALLWVYATLVITSRQVFDLLVHPLDAARSDGFYQSMKSLAALFGIPDQLLPRDFAALSAYFERMCTSDEIAVGEPARDMCRHLLQGAVWPFAPMWRWYSTMTAGLLPERLRTAYGLPWRRREQAEFQASVRAIGPLYRALPGSVRHLPAYQEAVYRLTGQKPSRASTLVDRLMAAAVGTIAGGTSTTPLRRG